MAEQGRGHAPDLRDPTSLAVEVVTTKGQVALLAQEVSAGHAAVMEKLNSLQVQVHEQARVLKSVESSQHDMRAHSQGLDRLAKAIENQSGDFSKWRDRHEVENKGVADKVTSFKGMLFGITLVAGLLGGAVIYNQQLRFQRVDERMIDHVEASAERQSRLETRLQRIETDIEKVTQTGGTR